MNLKNVLITVYLPDVINLKSTGYLWNLGIQYIVRNCYVSLLKWKNTWKLCHVQ